MAGVAPVPELILGCADLDATVLTLTDRYGFRLEAIVPADDPRQATLSGHGQRIVLVRTRDGDALPTAEALPTELPDLEPAFVLTKMDELSAWTTGRAGMLYRDLIPGRQGGRFIASHIRIEDGGPVPDHVHFHDVRFQLICCVKGWVRLVYEDQGPPFVLEAGDCVLQPPTIRHRVLESSAGLEVIEVACPAEHATTIDHDLELPTNTVDPDRRFDGQRFVRHEAADAAWTPDELVGFERRDTGIAAATNGLVDVRVLRPARETTETLSHDRELWFAFVSQGTASLTCEGKETVEVASGYAFVLPADITHQLTDASDDLRLLVVSAPA